MMNSQRAGGPNPQERRPDNRPDEDLATSPDTLRAARPALGRAGEGCCGSALWGWSPPDLPADTPLKRRADRLLPRSGAPAVACFAAVAGLLILAPHLPIRADLTADGLAALA